MTQAELTRIHLISYLDRIENTQIVKSERHASDSMDSFIVGYFHLFVLTVFTYGEKSRGKMHEQNILTFGTPQQNYKDRDDILKINSPTKKKVGIGFAANVSAQQRRVQGVHGVPLKESCSFFMDNF